MTAETRGAIRHPLNRNAFYGSDGQGGALVTIGELWGRFTPDGRHLGGPLFEADPELCLWVAMPRPDSHHRLSRVLDATGER